jgi:hypothetical protein
MCNLAQKYLDGRKTDDIRLIGEEALCQLPLG